MKDLLYISVLGTVGVLLAVFFIVLGNIIGSLL
jgi:hypothetical protein